MPYPEGTYDGAKPFTYDGLSIELKGNHPGAMGAVHGREVSENITVEASRNFTGPFAKPSGDGKTEPAPQGIAG